MSQSQLHDLADQYYILDEGLDETTLIRKIQLAEGNFDCFATARVSTCNQLGCRWRKDCQFKSTESA